MTGWNPAPDEQEEQRRLQQMRSCQTLNMVALIGAPVSLIIGGLALSVAALVCAIVSFAKMRKVVKPDDMAGSVPRTLYTQSLVCLVVSSVTTALNLVAFVAMFGVVMQALESGDLSALFDSLGDAPQNGTAPEKSIWD